MPLQATKIRWLMIAITFVVMAVMVADKVNISIAAPDIMRDFSLSKLSMGYLFSAYVLTYAFCCLIGGWIVDRYGPRAVVAASVVLWSAFTVFTPGSQLLFSGASGLSAMIVARALVGIGEGSTIPGFVRLVSLWFPAHERGFASSWIWAGNALANIFAPIAIAALLAAFSWKTIFYLLGCAGLPVALLWYLTVRNRPAEHPLSNLAEQARVGTEEVSDEAPLFGLQWLGPLQAILSNRVMQLLTLIALIAGYSSYFFYSWFFTYLLEVRHFSVPKGGLFMALPYLFAAIMAPAAGWISDYFTRIRGARVGRCAFGATICVAAAIAIYSGVAIEDSMMSIVFLAIGAALGVVFRTIMYATVMGAVEKNVGFATGYLLFADHIGGTVSPIMGAFVVSEWGWQASFTLVAAILLGAAAIWMLINPPDRSMTAATAIS